jgi:hypothetical protein
MRREFPDLFYVVSPGNYFTATWIAILREFPALSRYRRVIVTIVPE